MSSRFSRAAMALALVVSLWTSAIAVVAAPQQQQTQDKNQTQQKDKKNKKKPAASTDASSTATTTTQSAATTRALSTDENPDMIGKRKINGGFIASMSGSTESEVALGRQYAAQIDQQAKFIEDPVITEFVNRVGQNLVLHSDAKVPFTIKVIDSDEVNAFALPGGFFYVNKGLILAADNEAELAGAMAHEIAHVAARHGMETQAKMNILSGVATIGSIFVGGGVGGMILQNVAGLGLMASFLKFSRNAESEADRLGVQYLYAAGYDPNAMATMFEKLAAKNKNKPGFLSKAFSSHPQPPDRRAASIALVARFPEHEEYTINTSEFQRVKARLLRLSNARASSTDLGDTNDGTTPGRPTLKRRQPTPDDSTTTTPDDGSQTTKPDNTKPATTPTLRRNDGTTPPPPAQPASTP